MTVSIVKPTLGATSGWGTVLNTALDAIVTEVNVHATALGNGTFAVAANVAVNVRDQAYGAKGDGTTDDTAAIHAARNTGRTLFFPDGTYLVSGLVANVAGQRWNLAPGAIIKQISSSTTDLLTLSAAGAKINGGTIQGNRPYVQSNGSARAQGVLVTAANCEVSDLTITDAGKHGIYGVDGCDGLSLIRLTVLNSLEDGVLVKCTAADITGFRADGIFIDRTGLTGNPSTAATGWKEGGFKLKGSDDSTKKVRAPEVGRIVVKIPQDTTLFYSANGTVCVELWDLDGGNFDSISTTGGHCGLSVGRSSQHTHFGAVTIRRPITRGLEFGDNTTLDQFFTFDTVKIYGEGVLLRGIATGGTNRHNTFGQVWIKDAGIDYDSTQDGQGAGGGSAVAGSGIGAILSGTQSSTFGQFYCKTSTGSGAAIQVLNGSSVDFGQVQIERASANGQGLRFTGTSKCTVAGGSISGTSRDVYVDASTGTVTGLRIKGVRIFNLQVALTGSAALGTDNSLVDCAFQQDGKDADIIMLGTGSHLIDAKGTGSPEAVVNALIGSRFRRTDGGASTTLYVKESGTGNTGWIAK